MDQPNFGSLEEIFRNPFGEKEKVIIEGYLNDMVAFVEIFNVPREKARSELSKAIDFEIKLAKVGFDLVLFLKLFFLIL